MAEYMLRVNRKEPDGGRAYGIIYPDNTIVEFNRFARSEEKPV